MGSNLPLAWTQHIKDEKQREDFIAALRNSTIALGRLKDILTEMTKAAEIPAYADYDNPSWAYKQADMIGYRRCLRDIANLLRFLDKGN